MYTGVGPGPEVATARYDTSTQSVKNAASVDYIDNLKYETGRLGALGRLNGLFQTNLQQLPFSSDYRNRFGNRTTREIYDNFLNFVSENQKKEKDLRDDLFDVNKYPDLTFDDLKNDAVNAAQGEKKKMLYQQGLDNTAIRRHMRDLASSNVNPALAFSGNYGSQAPVSNVSGSSSHFGGINQKEKDRRLKEMLSILSIFAMIFSSGIRR